MIVIFFKGSIACVELEELAISKQMQKDIRKLSTGAQTASFERFHFVINHFIPKMCCFSYHGVLSRLNNGEHAKIKITITCGYSNNKSLI